MKTFFKSILTVSLLGFLFFWYFIKPSISVEPSRQSFGLHRGLNQTTEFFDLAYKDVSTEKSNDRIAGITINHHLLAPHLIAQQLQLTATEESSTIVLVSPNHFFQGSGGAIVSQFDWRTPFGNLEADQEVIQKLFDSGLVNIDEAPFEGEHGVSGVVGFIKKSLPNAKIVPLIIKENFSNEKVEELTRKLIEVLPRNSIIVGSFDFSHYLPSNAADFHDIQSIAVMNNFDYDRIDRLDVDSHSGLRLFLKYMDLTGNKKLVLTNHSNSSKVTNNFNLVETTSYINVYYAPGENPRDNRTTHLSFNGFDSQIASVEVLNPLNPKYAYAKSDRLFKYNVTTVTSYSSNNTDINEFLKMLGFNDFYDRTVYGLRSNRMAFGYVYDNLKLTDIYLFPLEVLNDQLVLLAGDKADTILAEMAEVSEVSQEIKNQILTGHITIK